MVVYQNNRLDSPVTVTPEMLADAIRAHVTHWRNWPFRRSASVALGYLGAWNPDEPSEMKAYEELQSQTWAIMREEAN